MSEHAFQAPQASKEELARAHCIGYVERFLRGELNDKEMRSIGFPWSEGLVRRSRASAGGTLAATRALLEWNLRITANIAGPYSNSLAVFCRRPPHPSSHVLSRRPGAKSYQRAKPAALMPPDESTQGE